MAETWSSTLTFVNARKAALTPVNQSRYVAIVGCRGEVVGVLVEASSVPLRVVNSKLPRESTFQVREIGYTVTIEYFVGLNCKTLSGSIESIDGCLYFVTSTDDFTHFSYIFRLRKKKSDVLKGL
jgi:hypothetical protein